MKPPKFHVGQAVVCISNGDANAPDVEDQGEGYPTIGPIYHIRDMVEGLAPNGKTLWGIRLKELINPIRDNGFEIAYWIDLFAPVELLPDEALARLLEETLEPVTA